ncbi:MAG: recombinase family protein, partial [Bilifractor sp.]
MIFCKMIIFSRFIIRTILNQFLKIIREDALLLNSSTNRKFGYARVSSKDQNLARQISALKEAGIEEN